MVQTPPAVRIRPVPCPVGPPRKKAPGRRNALPNCICPGAGLHRPLQSRDFRLSVGNDVAKLLVRPDIALEGGDIQVANQDCGPTALLPEYLGHLFDESKLVREFGIRLRIGLLAARRHVEIRDAHTALEFRHYMPRIAPPAIVAGSRIPDRNARDRQDSVVPRLAAQDGPWVARRRELSARDCLRRRLDFLQTKKVRLLLGEKAEHERQPQPDGVDVPSGNPDVHSSLLHLGLPDSIGSLARSQVSPPPCSAMFLFMKHLRRELEARARAEGFPATGVCRPGAAAHAGLRLREWVAMDHNGEMNWMADRIGWRADPRVLWPEARSVVMLADPYDPHGDPLEALETPTRGSIAAYARGRDYHEVLKRRLRRLAGWLQSAAGGEVKIFVDTAPVMEKPLAEAAGLGWQGKHTNLVSRELGSWFFLGAIFTTAELPVDEPHRDHCGSCRRCLDICPTDAFPAPYQLDARRCISYLTIEHRGPIPRELRRAIGNRIFGCDDCLAVCPWNRFAKAGRAASAYSPREGVHGASLRELAELHDAEFRERFRHTPIRRTGRDRMVRNALIALGNSGDESLAGTARRLLDDGSALVRGAAVWALSLLSPSEFLRERGARLPEESDPSVIEEWQLPPKGFPP